MIYINGNKADLYKAMALIDAEAENKGYDVDDALAVLWRALKDGCEEAADQMAADFGIEVVA